MIIAIITRTKYGHERCFSALVNSLETGLDAIDGIVATGDTLLRAQVFDGNQVLTLPIEAFDERPLLAPIQTLEKEYNRILSQPQTPLANRSDKLLEVLGRAQDGHEAYIARLQAAIVSLQQRLARAQKNVIDTLQPSPQINQLTANLERYQRLLAIAIDRRVCIEAGLRMVRW